MSAFAELGESWTVPEGVVTLIEQFTCLMYESKRVKEVNELRYSRLVSKCGKDGKLSMSKKIDLSSLPPCQSSLVEHIKRVNFQVAIWKCAHIPKVDFPEPTNGHGWTREKDGKMVPKWSGKDVLPPKLVDILDTISQEDAESDSEGEDSENDVSDGMDDEEESDCDF